MNTQDEDISFFAVQLEVWQIGDSAPAPKFNIISKPNEWAKIIKQSTGKDELTGTKIKQLDFWTKLKTYVAENRIPVRLQTPRPQHWYDISIGSSEGHIALTVNTRENLLSCELYISNNKDLFEYLKSSQVNIEKELGASLEWKAAEKACRIIQRKDDFVIDDGSRSEEYIKWLIDRVLVFQKVFGGLVKEFRKSN